jgi:hypothetical protein
MSKPDNAASIQKMLDIVMREMRELAERMGTLEARADTLRKWLREEAPLQGDLSIHFQETNPLDPFILGLLDSRSMTTADLAEAAVQKGLIHSRKSPKRVMNIVLQNLRTKNRIRKAGDAWIARK